MKTILPIFFSHYSIGRSILTLDKAAEELDPHKSVSIFTIAKLYNLSPIYILESSFSGFAEAFNQSQNANIPFVFGLQLRVCHNEAEKNETSRKTESKVNIWIKNSDGYADLMRIYSYASTTGFYYIPRIGWGKLNTMWTDNLALTVPFYRSFIHNNIMARYECVPMFDTIQPIFTYENHELPFNELIYKHLFEYCINNSFPIVETHSTYYYADADILAYQTYKCITNPAMYGKKNNIFKPQLDDFGTDDFSFEAYCNKTQTPFLPYGSPST